MNKTLEMLATFRKMSPQALTDPSTHKSEKKQGKVLHDAFLIHKSEEKRSTTMELRATFTRWWFQILHKFTPIPEESIPSLTCSPFFRWVETTTWAMIKSGRLGYIEDYTTQLCGDQLINHCKDLY